MMILNKINVLSLSESNIHRISSQSSLFLDKSQVSCVFVCGCNFVGGSAHQHQTQKETQKENERQTDFHLITTKQDKKNYTFASFSLSSE